MLWSPQHRRIVVGRPDDPDGPVRQDADVVEALVDGRRVGDLEDRVRRDHVHEGVGVVEARRLGFEATRRRSRCWGWIAGPAAAAGPPAHRRPTAGRCPGPSHSARWSRRRWSCRRCPGCPRSPASRQRWSANPTFPRSERTGGRRSCSRRTPPRRRDRHSARGSRSGRSRASATGSWTRRRRGRTRTGRRCRRRSPTRRRHRRRPPRRTACCPGAGPGSVSVPLATSKSIDGRRPEAVVQQSAEHDPSRLNVGQEVELRRVGARDDVIGAIGEVEVVDRRRLPGPARIAGEIAAHVRLGLVARTGVDRGQRPADRAAIRR